MTRAIDVVRAAAPLAKPNYLSAFDDGDSLLQQHEITTPARLAHFLAQVLHESGALQYEWESMRYRAERLVEIFGPRHSAKVTLAEARRLEGNPEAIAERVYGLGNPTKAAELGNSKPGDGFRYRGGGLMQTTGRANYREMGKKCDVDFEAHPELVVSPEHALKPALAEWSAGKLNAFADADDVLAISRAINLGNARSQRTPNGLEDRKHWLAKVRRLIDNAVTFHPMGGGATDGAVSTGEGADAMDLHEIQRRLRDMELYTAEIDGQYSPAAATAIRALLLNQGVANTEDWTELRQIVGAAQLFCRIDGIEVGRIDGLVGPQTREALRIYRIRSLNGGRPVPNVETWRDQDAENIADSSPVAPSAAASAAWPRESEVESFFGAPGSSQVTLILPFKMRLAWDLDTTVSKTSCHAKVHDSLERIWSRTLSHYGLDEIQRLRLDLFGGCLNVRRKRGGSGWSMHAYGIAWDVDPEHNALRMGRDDASLDGPEYDAFWSFVYDEGAIGLGRERNFDWMHFQFARL